MFGDSFSHLKVFLTGHTGFKGSWLALWLQELGAEVSGVALPPETTPNHWDSLTLAIKEHRMDIRNPGPLARIMEKVQPKIVFHLAAQPLVRRSYRDPIETWSTNVMGTVNLLEACRQTPSVRAIVLVTSDKCYENREWLWGYRENDRLGGHDPYSASKAATELVADSYRNAFFDRADAPLLATARAGNVVGGGDWSEDRLIPDLVRAITLNAPLEIRSPNATRPWQHVLEPIAGYLMLGQRLLQGERSFAEAWNFGPDTQDNLQVKDVLSKLQTLWPELRWQEAPDPLLHEASMLHIDCTKARHHLGWRPAWSLDQGLAATALWYRAYLEHARVISSEQLRDYITQAQAAGLEWTAH